MILLLNVLSHVIKLLWTDLILIVVYFVTFKKIYQQRCFMNAMIFHLFGFFFSEFLSNVFPFYIPS